MVLVVEGVVVLVLVLVVVVVLVVVGVLALVVVVAFVVVVAVEVVIGRGSGTVRNRSLETGEIETFLIRASVSLKKIETDLLGSWWP